MAVTTGAAKKQRGRAIENNGGLDIFTELLAEFVSETKVKPRRKLGLALLPYIMPKLRSVDITSKVDVAVTVKIGGIEVDKATQLGNDTGVTQLGSGAGQVIDEVADAVLMSDEEFEGEVKSA